MAETDKKPSEEMNSSKARKEQKEKEIEDEISSKLEESAEKWADDLEKKIESEIEEKVPKYAEPVAGAIFMTIFVVLVNLYWDRFEFLTEEFSDLLPIYNAIVLIGIGINILRIFIQSKTFKLFGEVVNAVLMAYFAYLLWTVYPFDVTGIWDTLIKFMIVVPTVLTFFGVFVGVMKFVRGKED